MQFIHERQSCTNVEYPSLLQETLGNFSTHLTYGKGTQKDQQDSQLLQSTQTLTSQTQHQNIDHPFTIAKIIPAIQSHFSDPRAINKPLTINSSPHSLIHISSANSNATIQHNPPKPNTVMESNLFKQILAQFEHLKSPTDQLTSSHSISLLVSLSGKSCFAIQPTDSNPPPTIIPNTSLNFSSAQNSNQSAPNAFHTTPIDLYKAKQKTKFLTKEGQGESTILGESQIPKRSTPEKEEQQSDGDEVPILPYLQEGKNKRAESSTRKAKK